MVIGAVALLAWMSQEYTRADGGVAVCCGGARADLGGGEDFAAPGDHFFAGGDVGCGK